MAAHNPGPLEAELDEYDYESLPPNFSLSANMVAGAFAGIAEHTVMYPIDAIKTRMQIVNPSPSAVYTGIFNGLGRVSSQEGIRTLWKGISSVALGAGPAHAVYFATYEAVKQAMGGNDPSRHHPLAAGMSLLTGSAADYVFLVADQGVATSGACATIMSDAIMNPFDVIKQRMQVHNSIHPTILRCAISVYRYEGLRAFYVSYPTTLCMTIPFTALQFTAYESLSKIMNPTKQHNPMTHIVAGGLAGGFAAGVTTPIDVIKTLLQTRGNAQDVEIRNAKGLFEAARIIKERDGLKGFFRGLRPRIITTMPSTAICWASYEAAKAYFVAQNDA